MFSKLYSSKALKIKSFKKLSKKSGLLAILCHACTYGRNFTWSELVQEIDYEKVLNAYNNWQINTIVDRYLVV